MKKSSIPFLMLGLIVIGLASCKEIHVTESCDGQLKSIGPAGGEYRWHPLPEIIIEPVGNDWLVLAPIDKPTELLSGDRILRLDRKLDAVKKTYDWWWNGGLEKKPNLISPYRLTSRRFINLSFHRCMARTGTDYLVIDTIGVDPIIGQPGGLGDDAKIRMVFLPYLYTHPGDSIQCQKGQKKSQNHKFGIKRTITSIPARFIKFEGDQFKIGGGEEKTRETTDTSFLVFLGLCLAFVLIVFSISFFKKISKKRKPQKDERIFW